MPFTLPLHLQFEIAGHPYLLETGRVAAVSPLPLLKPLPGAPAGVVGVVNHRGAPVPVVDLALLATGSRAPDRLSTRLVLVRHPTPAGERLLGLVVERATSVIRVDEADVAPTGVTAAPWLGGVAPAGDKSGGLAQLVDTHALLTPEVSAALFRAAEEAPA